MIKRWIEVSFRRAGLHHYPGAVSDPKLAAVNYLANVHRHLFHFNVRIEVFHDDREIEFLIFLADMESVFNKDNFDNKSCEMLGDIIIGYAMNKYLGRDIEVKVSEDGENGSVTSYKAER